MGLEKMPKKDSEKDFCKLMNNIVFGKTIENVLTHRNSKLENNDKINYLVSEQN